MADSGMRDRVQYPIRCSEEMKLTFFVNYLNHHQLPVADELYRILGDDFRFVATFLRNPAELKGGEDGSARPYCLLPAEREEDMREARRLVLESDVCLFGAGNLYWERLRAKTDKLSFEISERWFKRGWLNLLSPRLWQWWWLYQTRLRFKPFYKLCASAFTAADCRKLLAFRNKCYQWGYFPSMTVPVPDYDPGPVPRIIWCARLISWKHPEIVIRVAHRLKASGYRFEVSLYGDGPLRNTLQSLIDGLDVADVAVLKGNLPHNEILEAMATSDISLLTSDRNEGWGAVVNEAMSQECCVIGSNQIGSIPSLIEDGCNGLIYDGGNPEDNLYLKFRYALDNPQDCRRMAVRARRDLETVWSPRSAAERLLTLIDVLKNNKTTPFTHGPCSIAL